MSLLNAWLSDRADCALVAVDSEGRNGDGIHRACKLVMLPHLPGVVAGVGSNFTLYHLFWSCITHQSTLDDLVADMPAVLRKAYAAGVRTAEERQLQPAHAMSVLICGWSETKQRVVAHHFNKPDEEKSGFTGAEICPGDWLLQPMPAEWRADFAKLAPPADPDRMATLAWIQTNMAREKFPDVHIGRLIVAELERKRMTIHYKPEAA